MKKENFVALINAITAHEEKEDQFIEALAPFFDNGLIFELTVNFRSQIIRILENEMNDPECNSIGGSIISWWLYDAPNRGREKSSAYIEDNGVKILLETAEQLFDYLNRLGKN